MKDSQFGISPVNYSDGLADNVAYQHDGHVNNAAYLHDRCADKGNAAYPHAVLLIRILISMAVLRISGVIGTTEL